MPEKVTYDQLYDFQKQGKGSQQIHKEKLAKDSEKQKIDSDYGSEFLENKGESSCSNNKQMKKQISEMGD